MLGVAAGGMHSLFQPVALVPEPPPKLDIPAEPLAAPAPSNSTSTTAAPTPTTTNAATNPPAATALADGDITLGQARALYQQNVMFVDARNLDEYTQGHIEGAVHLPLEALEGGARPEALNMLDPGAKVVIYCGGGDCHASHDVAIRLNALGFKSCYVLKDGFPAWKAAGYEVIGGAP